MMRLLRYVPLVLFGSGVIAFVINLILGAGFWKPEVELPLWDIQQVKCDGDHIHVALGYYSRIQTYDHEGRMVRISQVDNFSKPYSFRLDVTGEPVIRVRGFVPANEHPVARWKSWKYVVDAPCGLQVSQPMIYQLVGGPILPWMLAGVGLLCSMVLFPSVLSKLLSGTKASG